MKVNEIKDLVNSLSQTDYKYINVKHEGTEITLSDEPISNDSYSHKEYNTNNEVTPEIKALDTKVNNDTAGKSEEKAVKENIDSDDSCYIVKSPLVGTFYNAPSPEASPYVQVGDKVKKGDVLCIIEAMKLMNDISSDVNGEVVEILASNESGIEYGQGLFKINESK